MKTYLTFDVGGSAIKYALIQEDLSILDKSSVPTPMDSLEHFVETIGEIYDRYASQISGIAISMPGIIDPKRIFLYWRGITLHRKIGNCKSSASKMSYQYNDWK